MKIVSSILYRVFSWNIMESGLFHKNSSHSKMLKMSPAFTNISNILIKPKTRKISVLGSQVNK